MEEKDIAKEYRDFEYNSMRYSDDRLNKLSDGLSEKMLQITGLVFALPATFIGKNELVSFLSKILFSSGLIILLFAIVFGVVHEYVKQKFWQNQSMMRKRTFEAFDKARREKITLQEAVARYDEISVSKGIHSSPDWALKVQRILLLVGVSVVLSSVLVSLFS